MNKYLPVLLLLNFSDAMAGDFVSGVSAKETIANPGRAPFPGFSEASLLRELRKAANRLPKSEEYWRNRSLGIHIRGEKDFFEREAAAADAAMRAAIERDEKSLSGVISY